MAIPGSPATAEPRPAAPQVQAAATTSLVLEIVFGFFSLLGVGHVYTGRIGLGLALMVGWWIFLGVAATISSLTAGLAACLFVPIYFVVPVISGVQASAYVKTAMVSGSWSSVAMVVGGGCLVVMVSLIALAFMFGLLSLGLLGALFQYQ
jgi:hypothetical protein